MHLAPLLSPPQVQGESDCFLHPSSACALYGSAQQLPDLSSWTRELGRKIELLRYLRRRSEGDHSKAHRNSPRDNAPATVVVQGLQSSHNRQQVRPSPHLSVDVTIRSHDLQIARDVSNGDASLQLAACRLRGPTLHCHPPQPTTSPHFYEYTSLSPPRARSCWPPPAGRGCRGSGRNDAHRKLLPRNLWLTASQQSDIKPPSVRRPVLEV